MALVYVDPGMGGAEQLDALYDSRLSQTLADLYQATAYVSDESLSKVAGDVFRAANIAVPADAELSHLAVENQIRNKYFPGMPSVKKNYTGTVPVPADESGPQEVSQDATPGRLGFEYEYGGVVFRRNGRELPSRFHEKAVIETAVKVKGYPLLKIAIEESSLVESPGGHDSAIIEIISGPQTTADIENGEMRQAIRVITEQLDGIIAGQQGSVTIDELTRLCNEAFEQEGISEQFRLHDVSADITNRGRLTLQPSGVDARTLQTNLSHDYRAIGDPHSGAGVLVATSDVKRRVFLHLAQFEASKIASAMTSAPSAELKAFLTHFLYQETVKTVYGIGGHLFKSNEEHQFRIGTADAVATVLSDSDVGVLRSRSQSWYTDKITGGLDNILTESQTPVLDERQQSSRNRFVASDINTAFVEVPRLRERYGSRFQIPMVGRSSATYLDSIPVAPGARELLDVNALRSDLRQPVVDDGHGHFFVTSEVRNSKNNFNKLITTPAAEASLKGYLEYLQHYGAEPTDDTLSVLIDQHRSSYESLESTNESREEGGFHFYLNQQLEQTFNGLNNDQRNHLADVYLTRAARDFNLSQNEAMSRMVDLLVAEPGSASHFRVRQ